MKVKQVDVIGPQRLEPKIHSFEHVAGPRDAILGGQKDLGTNLRHGREPFLEWLLGSIGGGRVEEPNATTVFESQQPFDGAGCARGSPVEDRDLHPCLAQDALGYLERLTGPWCVVLSQGLGLR